MIIIYNYDCNLCIILFLEENPELENRFLVQVPTTPCPLGHVRIRGRCRFVMD